MELEPNYLRQLGLLPLDKIKSVTLIGAGSVGSFTALVLAKMGIPLTVWDDDRLEDHNLPNQFYPTKDLGKYKVEALQVLLKDFAAVDVIVRSQRFSREDLLLDSVVVNTVDSMASRTEVWEVAKKNGTTRLLIDCRVGAQVIRIFSVPIGVKKLHEWYEDSLYTDEEAEEAPCSARSIVYTPAIAGALIGGLLNQHFNGQPIPKHILRSIPDYYMDHAELVSAQS